MRQEHDGAPGSGAAEAGAERQAEHTIVIEDEALRRGFTQLPNYLFQVRGLSHSAKLTYALILSYAWQKDYCFPGQETLARDLEVSTRSVIEYLKELQQQRLIRIQRRGLGLTNIYHVLRYPPAPQTAPTPSHQEVKPASHQGLKRATPPAMPPRSHADLSQNTPLEVQPRSHKKDAPPKHTDPEKTRQQERAAAPISRQTEDAQSDTLPPHSDVLDRAVEKRMARAALQAYGIDNDRLLSDLTDEPHEALLQIERLRQEIARGVVANPAGWLVEAIRGRYRATLEASTLALEIAPRPSLPTTGVRYDADVEPATPHGMAWEMVRAELRAELTPENYQRWFMPTTPVALEDDRLTVAVPDVFHLQWLDRRLRGTIERAAQRVLGDVTIAFIVASRATA